MRFAFVLLLATIFVSNPAHAWQGTIAFTEREVSEHAVAVPRIISTAVACLQNDLDRHQSFFKQYRVSRFYGDRSAFGKMKDGERLEHIKGVLYNLGYRPQEIPKLASYIFSQMEPTSCVGLVLKCLGNGFKQNGQAEVWARIAAYARLNGQDGTSIQNALQGLGWRVLYWNPWTQFSAQWDATEQAKDPTNENRFWGYHAYRLKTVMGQHKYLYNTVDDVTTLVNFGRTVPASFRSIPFFVGTAHTGSHVFPGMAGNVIEGHSTRQITDGQTLESSPFNPLEDGGAPRGSYYSGLVAVPPGY
jgi:hypothetical protein